GEFSRLMPILPSIALFHPHLNPYFDRPLITRIFKDQIENERPYHHKINSHSSHNPPPKTLAGS
ncbi:MAG: hypothetical protein VXZ18_12300, partial [Pseudomonadota bacterium]|nr:hypothetical protein [Pseudomonadota bacterium]